MKKYHLMDVVLLLLSVLLLTFCSGSSGGGTGGTGIISRGTITEFGSVVVNGTEFNTGTAVVMVGGKEVGSITRSGEYFGEMSAILKEKRSATVISMGRSKVQVFSVENLPAVLESYPQLSLSIIDTLAKRLFEANKKIAT